MNNLGISEGELDLIYDVFSQNAAIEKAAVFGSRAKGNFRKYSDIDIALFSNENLLNVEDVIHRLEQLPLVYKFDVVAYETIRNAALREHIDRVGVVIYKRDTVR